MIDLPYHPYYCEENSWHICRLLEQTGHAQETLFLVFLIPAGTCVPLRAQRSAKPGEIICWDYHVVVLDRGGETSRIWDPESILSSPIALDEYLDTTLVPARSRTLPVLARLVAWPVAKREFASDRRHMIDRSTVEPPPWPPIGHGHTLPGFLDPMSDRFGSLLSTDSLRLYSR